MDADKQTHGYPQACHFEKIRLILFSSFNSQKIYKRNFVNIMIFPPLIKNKLVQ